MTDPRTPAQIAGLIPSSKTEHELMLEEIATTVRGADGLTFNQRKSAEKLARRRELLAEATTIAEANVKAAEDLERKRSKVIARLEAAEKEWRAAQEAARGLPLWASDGGRRLAHINRELLETSDPRLRELQTWLERESDVTRCYDLPYGLVQEDPFSGRRSSAEETAHIQGILRALQQRHVAIREALAATSAAMLEALTDSEIEARIEQILALVPAIPAGAAQRAPLPMPLTIDGRAPAPHAQQHEAAVAAVGEKFKRAAKTIPRLRR